MWLDIEGKTKSELVLELPPGLRALSPRQQVAAIVHLRAQLQKVTESKPTSPGLVSPVPRSGESKSCMHNGIARGC